MLLKFLYLRLVRTKTSSLNSIWGTHLKVKQGTSKSSNSVAHSTFKWRRNQLDSASQAEPHLKRGVGVYGGGCQDKPFVRSLVRAEAVDRAAGVGAVVVLAA